MRPNKFDRVKQPLIGFRADEHIKNQFKNACLQNGESMQEVLEKAVIEYIHKTMLK